MIYEAQSFEKKYGSLQLIYGASWLTDAAV